MAEAFRMLGIHGIPQQEETLMLQSLVTGDPMLMIGKHGSAKTALAEMTATALGVKFQDYDASKSMFEDMLGMPSPSAMQQGRMEYIESPMTLWDKEFLFVDEVNRAAPEMQSKWLEIIRSRQVMGFMLNVKFLWGAMNPMGYEGTQVMDEAYAGRFATFVYIPSVIDMGHDDRQAIIDTVGVDDGPAIGYWTDKKAEKTVKDVDLQVAGVKLKLLLKLAQEQYQILSQDKSLKSVTMFLSKFAKSIYARTKSSDSSDKTTSIELDGRRLGMMRRAIIAARSIEIASAQVFGTNLGTFINTASYTILNTIPTGVNADGGVDEASEAHISNTFQQLQDYFDENADMKLIELNYELMVSNDIVRKAEILLSEDIREITKNSVWTKILTETSLDISVLSLLAMNLEVKNRGILPANIIDQMSKKISSDLLKPKIPPLIGDQLNYYSRFKEIIEIGNNLIEKLLICHHIKNTVATTQNGISDVHIATLEKICKKDIARLQRIYSASKRKIERIEDASDKVRAEAAV